MIWNNMIFSELMFNMWDNILVCALENWIFVTLQYVGHINSHYTINLSAEKFRTNTKIMKFIYRNTLKKVRNKMYLLHNTHMSRQNTFFVPR